MAGLGVLVLRSVSLASGVGLPRWCGALIIAASPPIVFFLAVSWPFFVEESQIGSSFRRFMFALVGVAWTLAAYALFLRARGRRSEQPPDVV